MTPPSSQAAGNELWAFRTPSPGAIVGEPLVFRDHVAFTKGETLYVLDRGDGSLVWSSPLVRRSALTRWLRRSSEDFEATQGIPQLSIFGRSLVVSFQSTEGDPIDLAFDLETQESHEVEGFDPFTVRAGEDRYAVVEGRTTGAAPVLIAVDGRGNVQWDSRWAFSEGFQAPEWLSPVGRPVVGDGRVFFGIRETTLERGTAVSHRLYGFRVTDGELLWEHPNHALDQEVLSIGYDAPHFYVLVRQREGIPRLRFLDAESGKTGREALFPDLTGAATVAGGILYGGFGRSLVAVELQF